MILRSTDALPKWKNKAPDPGRGFHGKPGTLGDSKPAQAEAPKLSDARSPASRTRSRLPKQTAPQYFQLNHLNLYLKI
jgi:hypothetical protein